MQSGSMRPTQQKLLDNIRERNYNYIHQVFVEHPQLLTEEKYKDTFFLHQAVYANSPSIVKLLLSSGINQTLKIASVRKLNKASSNYENVSAIETAAILDRWDCVEIFINHPKTIVDESYARVLFYALQVKRIDLAIQLANLLMSHPNYLNMAIQQGNTVLHLAVQQEQLYLVGKLVEKGANIDKKNDQGQSPLDLANQMSSREACRNALLLPLKEWHAPSYCEALFQEEEEQPRHEKVDKKDVLTYLKQASNLRPQLVKKILGEALYEAENMPEPSLSLAKLIRQKRGPLAPHPNHGTWVKFRDFYYDRLYWLPDPPPSSMDSSKESKPLPENQIIFNKFEELMNGSKKLSPPLVKEQYQRLRLPPFDFERSGKQYADVIELLKKPIYTLQYFTKETILSTRCVKLDAEAIMRTPHAILVMLKESQDFSVFMELLEQSISLSRKLDPTLPVETEYKNIAKEFETEKNFLQSVLDCLPLDRLHDGVEKNGHAYYGSIYEGSKIKMELLVKKLLALQDVKNFSKEFLGILGDDISAIQKAIDEMIHHSAMPSLNCDSAKKEKFLFLDAQSLINSRMLANFQLHLGALKELQAAYNLFLAVERVTEPEEIKEVPSTPQRGKSSSFLHALGTFKTFVSQNPTVVPSPEKPRVANVTPLPVPVAPASRHYAGSIFSSPPSGKDRDAESAWILSSMRRSHNPSS